MHAQATYIYPRDATSVIEPVQFGTLEFHPWGATVAQPDKADRVVFDFDPGPFVAWKRMLSAVRLVRELLSRMGLESFVRTTGGKGLHVMVPLNPACPWSQVKAFAHAFADSLALADPLEFVATASKTKRGKKIYVDYLRNSRGATSVASYSLRARPGRTGGHAAALERAGPTAQRTRVHYQIRAQAAGTAGGRSMERHQYAGAGS